MWRDEDETEDILLLLTDPCDRLDDDEMLFRILHFSTPTNRSGRGREERKWSRHEMIKGIRDSKRDEKREDSRVLVWRLLLNFFVIQIWCPWFKWNYYYHHRHLIKGEEVTSIRTLGNKTCHVPPHNDISVPFFFVVASYHDFLITSCSLSLLFSKMQFMSAKISRQNSHYDHRHRSIHDEKRKSRSPSFMYLFSRMKGMNPLDHHLWSKNPFSQFAWWYLDEELMITWCSHKWANEMWSSLLSWINFPNDVDCTRDADGVHSSVWSDFVQMLKIHGWSW